MLTNIYQREQQATARQSESEAKFELLFQHNPLPMWVYDLSTLEFLAVNQTSVNTYGYSKEEFLNMTLRDIRPVEDVHRLLTDVAKPWPPLNFAGEWRHRRKDGTVFPVEIFSYALAYDGRNARLVVAQDITTRKQAEESFRESEARFRKAIEEAPLPAIIHAEDGEILAMSRSWMEITGYELSDIPTIAAWTERAYGNRQEAVQAEIDQLYALDRRLDEGEFEITCADGEQRVWMFSSTPLGRIADGRRVVVSMGMDVTERKETENRMQLLIASLEAAANAIVLTDVNGNLEWVNSAFSELTGYTREEALGRNPRELVKSGKHSQKFFEKLWNTILEGQVWRGEIINRRKDGSLYTEEESITPVRNTAGEIKHFIAVKQDISERKRGELALQENESRYRSLFENNKMVMLLSDPEDGSIVDANQAAVDFYGWSKEELKQKKIKDINTLSSAEVKLEMEQAKNEKRTHFLFRHRLADGRTRDVEVSSGPVHLDGYALLYSTIIDVTDKMEIERERKQLLAQVQMQADQLLQIMHSVPTGVCLLDPDCVLLMANPRAEAKLAFLADVSLGEKLISLGERPIASLLTSPPLGKWHSVEKNGRIFQVLAQPLENEPVSQGWVLVIWEVTEQRMIQRQLQSQERLAAVGQLAAGIAHDFNNILAVIILYAQNLQRFQTPSEKEKNSLRVIVEQAHRASELIQQVLDFSRRSIMLAKPLDMLPLLKEEVKLLQRTLPEYITVKLKNSERTHVVHADPTHLQQVVMNLALNARDAMPNGGELIFEVDKINVPNQKQAPLPHMNSGTWVRLRVSDTGTGIEPAILDHIFEPFFTTKEPGKGTGLGLAQVHGIIGQHGGHITAESQLNVGTTFTIYIPAYEAQLVQPTNHVEELDVPHGNGDLILIAEDNTPLREALTAVLTNWNYQVIATKNGAEALRLLKTSTQEIRLVISDIVMPEMGGIGLLRAMRDAGWEIPVIFLTGHPLDNAEADLQRQGVVQVLFKPLDIIKLGNMCTRILNPI